jgi:tRNA pseudouridine38-40 synthase
MTAAEPRNYRLILEYDGTRYVGWERQDNGLSIQAVLEEALFTITRERLTTEASGRTDAGVHAKAQVVSVAIQRKVVPRKLRLGLNAVLPEDIAVRAVEEVPANFHARKSAKSKHYRYTLLTGPVRSPLLRHNTFHFPQALDVSKMDAAARLLEGKHDFSAFAKEAKKKKSCVRSILESRVSADGSLVHVDLVATGFLYNMVRIITGTLIEVGLGRRPMESMSALLKGGSRAHAGFTVPPQGLTLMRVDYPEPR